MVCVGCGLPEMRGDAAAVRLGVRYICTICEKEIAMRMSSINLRFQHSLYSYSEYP